MRARERAGERSVDQSYGREIVRSSVSVIEGKGLRRVGLHCFFHSIENVHCRHSAAGETTADLIGDTHASTYVVADRNWIASRERDHTEASVCRTI